MESDGVSIRVGDLALLDNGAANHDPIVFAEPNRTASTSPARLPPTSLSATASATASAHHCPAWNYKPCLPTDPTLSHHVPGRARRGPLGLARRADERARYSSGDVGQLIDCVVVSRK